MATVTKPIALDESLNTTEQTPRNIADVLAQELSRITGRNASQVEYDNSESGLDADNVQDAIDEVNGKIPTLPTTDIQTAVDEFETYNGGLLSECKVALSPNQDLHGYDSPWVGGAGKNVVILDLDTIKARNTSGTWSGDVYIFNGVSWSFITDDGGNITEVVANNQATADSTLIISITNSKLTAGVAYFYNGCPSGGTSSTYRDFVRGGGYDYGSGNQITPTQKNIDNNYYDFRMVVLNGYNAQNLKFKPLMQLSSLTDRTFAPYSNICPISGHTQVEVDVSDGQTTQEQVTVNLGGTYYSGTLDVVSGVFTPDTASQNVTSVSRNSATSYYASVGGEPAKVSNFDTVTSDKLPTSSDGAEVGVFINSQGAIRINTPNGYATSADMISAYGGSIQIVYELATPTPIQLSPTMVKALVGENHLSTPLEGQEITESKYKQMFTFDDVIAYIQSLS